MYSFPRKEFKILNLQLNGVCICCVDYLICLLLLAKMSNQGVLLVVCDALYFAQPTIPVLLEPAYTAVEQHPRS